MDLVAALRQLHAEKHKLDHAIEALQDLQRASVSVESLLSSGKGRGRKSMGAEERKEVSKRMKKYWTNRRRTGKDSIRKAT
jgi:hypothetical protein